jgi:hypothetical protein
MDTADFNHSDFENRYASDRGVHAKFYMFPQQDESASISAGRPIYTETEFVEIMAPGSAGNIVRRPARDQDRQRFARQYAAFQQGKGEELFGTPLMEVPWITRSQVEELAHVQLRTLEQLSEVGDNVCGRIPGLHDLKRKAISALAAADAGAPLAALEEENKNLRGEIDVMKDQIEKLVQALKEKTEEKK